MRSGRPQFLHTPSVAQGVEGQDALRSGTGGLLIGRSHRAAFADFIYPAQDDHLIRPEKHCRNPVAIAVNIDEVSLRA